MFRGTGGLFGSEKHSATASPSSGDGGDAEPFGGRAGYARTGRGAGPDGKGLWVKGGEIKGINLSGRIDVAIGGRFPQRASETRSSRQDMKPLSVAIRMHGLFEHGSPPR
jgi:hypothetical protein